MQKKSMEKPTMIRNLQLDRLILRHGARAYKPPEGIG